MALSGKGNAQSRLVLLALAFYFFLAGLGVGLLLLWGSSADALELIKGRKPWLWQLAMGVVVGFGIVGYSVITVRYFPLARTLAVRMANLTGPIGKRDAFILALLSGLAEEFFFRIVLLLPMGRFGSSLLFGAMHFGPHKAFILWAVTAATLGALFAVLVLAGWGLTAVATAHFLTNVINLVMLGRMAHRLQKVEEDLK